MRDEHAIAACRALVHTVVRIFALHRMYDYLFGQLSISHTFAEDL